MILVNRNGRVQQTLISKLESRRIVAVAILATILTSSIILKLGSLDQFLRVISKTFGMPLIWSQALGLGVIAIEMFAVLALARKKTRNIGLLACSSLFASFICFHLLKIMFQIAVPCTCFGAFYKMSPSTGVVLSLILFVTSESLRFFSTEK